MNEANLKHDFNDWDKIKDLPEYQLVLKGFVIDKLIAHLHPGIQAPSEEHKKVWTELYQKDTETLIKDLEKTGTIEKGELERAMEKEWINHSQFVHKHESGIRRVVKKFQPRGYPSNPTDDEIKEALQEGKESENKPN